MIPLIYVQQNHFPSHHVWFLSFFAWNKSDSPFVVSVVWRVIRNACCPEPTVSTKVEDEYSLQTCVTFLQVATLQESFWLHFVIHRMDVVVFSWSIIYWGCDLLWTSWKECWLDFLSSPNTKVRATLTISSLIKSSLYILIWHFYNIVSSKITTYIRLVAILEVQASVHSGSTVRIVLGLVWQMWSIMSAILMSRFNYLQYV